MSVYIRLLCFLLASLLMAFQPPFTQAATSQAKSKTESSPLTRYWSISNTGQPENSQSLDLFFRIDEKRCQERYGKQSELICSRKTGMAGRQGRSASIDPKVNGDWRWVTDTYLMFTPKDSWPAGRNFTVYIPKQALPEDTQLRPERLTVSTAPVSARMSGVFRVDPQRPETMAVSGRIFFNYPMNHDSVVERLRLIPQSKSLLLGEPVFTWDGSNPQTDTVLFSVPVLSLPESETSLRLALDAGAVAASGGAPAKKQEINVALPGRQTLFMLNEIDAAVTTPSDLRARQSLLLHFSLPTTPRAVSGAIEAFLLPRQRIESGEKRPPYNWWSTEEIDENVLRKATSVRLALPQGADTPGLLTQLELAEEIEPGRCLYVRLAAGLAGPNKLTLKNGVNAIVRIPEFPEELRVMQRGSVLALTGDRALSVYSRNLDAVSYELVRVRQDQINHFLAPLTQGLGSYAKPALENSNLYAVSTVTKGNLPLSRKDARSPQFFALKLDELLQGQSPAGLYMLRLEGLRGDKSVAKDSRFVLVTDLGLIRKTFPDNTGVLYVASLSKGKPAQDVAVSVLGANGLPVFEGRTDAEGKLSLPALKGLKNEKRPQAVMATREGDLAVLPFDDAERNINYSRFEVDGNTSSAGGLNAYLFGERDLYRPGETVHFGYILKQGMWKSLEGLPLRANVYDSRGNLFATRTLKADASGLGELVWELPEAAIPGLYRMDLLLDDKKDAPLVADASFRVEEFQPDTLKLTVLLENAPKQGWICTSAPSAATQTAQVDLQNLFGAPAAGHDVKSSVRMEKTSFSFKSYPGWTFYDAAPLADVLTQNLPNAKTAEDGKTRLNLPADLLKSGSGRLTLRVEGLDAGGGRGVKALSRTLVSPLAHLVGWKTGSNLQFLPHKGQAELSLVAVNPNLSPADLGEVSLHTLAVSYVTSLFRDESGQYRYDKLRQEKDVASRGATLGAKGLSLPLDLSTPGEKVLEVRGKSNELLARIPYVVAGEAAARFGEDRDPALVARLNKTDYAPGDEIEAYISTPYKGAGLITIEQDRVVAQTWFASTAGDTVQRVRLPRDFEGRGYLNVTYFRALDDKDIFTKPLATAVVPFTVNMDGRDLGLALKLPEAAKGTLATVRPGTTVSVGLSARRPGKAVLFAVDEGILQMSSYATPNPLKALLGERALEVVTSQFFDLLMPEYNLIQSSLSAFGGGEDTATSPMGQNPFRRKGEPSAVFWSGIVDVGPDAKTVDIPVPQSFSGQWRIMAVGASGNRVSAARGDVLVQAEVVIEPSVPLFVAPGDTFEAAVTLTDMSGLADKTAGRPVRLRLTPGEGFAPASPLEQPDQPLTLFPAKSTTVRTKLRALDVPGAHALVFRVVPEKGGHEVVRQASLSVRPATPAVTLLSLGTLAKDAPLSLPFNRQIYPQEAKLSVSVSALPLPAVHGLATYLATYPYNCTEQIVSAAMPALVLLRHPEYAPRGKAFTQEALRKRVQTTLDILQARHNGMGAFSQWASGYEGDLFLSAYVADFLTSAAENGVAVPLGLRDSVLENLKERAASPVFTLREAGVTAYAAWVLTRNGVITSNIMSTLTATLNDNFRNWEQDITAALMAGCWQLMMGKSEASRLLNLCAPEKATFNGDPLAARALYVSLLARHFPEKFRSASGQTALHELLALTNERAPVTLTSALTARALTDCCGTLKTGPSEMGVSVASRNGQLKKLELEGDKVRTATLEGKNAAAVNKVTVTSESPAFWQVESTGYDRRLPTTPGHDGLEISRELRTLDGKPLAGVKLGDEFVVVIRARAYGKRVANVAIADLLPGGVSTTVSENGSLTEVGGGVRIDNGTVSGARSSDQPMDVDHVERREDRIVVIASLDTAESVFRYKVRAVTKGTFTLPPLQAEAMYEPALRAHTAVDQLTIN